MTEPCPEFEDLLDEYAEGLVEQHERWRVEAHVAECQSCREYIAERDQLGRLLREVFRRPMSREPSRLVARSKTRPLAIVAALAVLLVAVSWWLGHARPDVGKDVVLAESPAPAAERRRLADGEGLADWEASIDREASAARLAAAADVLAGQYTTSEYAAGAVRFLAKTFPDTIAGRAAARRLGANDKE